MPREAPRSTGPARIPRVLAAVAALCLGLAQEASVATGGRAIELRDGSVLMGELVSAGNGHYRIRTPVLGEIELPESEVLAIRSAPTSAPNPVDPSLGATDLQGLMSAIQGQIVGDPSLAGAITALQSDPELQAALADPAFTQLILSGNLMALSGDPRFLRLMANPAIQSLLGRIGGQPGGQIPGR
jgi:hypothetical protein